MKNREKTIEHIDEDSREHSLQVLNTYYTARKRNINIYFFWFSITLQLKSWAPQVSCGKYLRSYIFPLKQYHLPDYWFNSCHCTIWSWIICPRTNIQQDKYKPLPSILSDDYDFVTSCFDSKQVSFSSSEAFRCFTKKVPEC